ncbi:sugar transferase [Actinomadura litoris]|uniref:sugar transferase n=1 Tax=Actinomadura litoris TaxID=2678616 RepID=UPI001FA81345|nr:sugar transferase [Actinomadura litoris]
MRAQGLSASLDPGAPRSDLSPTSGDAAALPLLPDRRAAGSRVLARLYPACLALADAWAASTAVASLQVRAGGASMLASVVVVGLNAAGGLYRVRRSPSLLADLRPVLVRALVVGVLVAAMVPGSSWFTVVWIGVVACGLSLGARAVAHAAVRTYRCRRTRARLALVVGTGAAAAHVVHLLRVRGEFGLVPVGQVTAGPPDAAAALPVLGGTTDLPALVRDHGADTVMVVAEDIGAGQLDAVLRVSFGLACETLLVQPPSDVVPVAAARREYLAGLPCARVDWPLREPGARLAKRVFDLVVASLLLVGAAPLLAACALAVRLEGGPGVLFRQRRVGLGGEEFVLLKFRTLKPVDEEESDTRWTVEDDDRVGPVGRFLRRSSFDELPQLWNVVRGDMSLVGPRPERPHFVEQFSRTCPGYRLRHRVPVGMTGWAQVHGFRGDTSIELRARLDNHYIDHWSFASDLRILLLTARAMLCRDPG